MTLFTVNAETCARDGLCASACPAGCIDWQPGQLPTPHERKFAYCIECGHCVAVCPYGALRLERFPAGPVPLDSACRPSIEQVEGLIMARRSMRVYKPEPPARDAVARLLDLTQYAPSGHNARPVRWVVVSTQQGVRTVAEAIVDWMRDEAQRETPLAATLHLAGLVAAFDAGVDMICRDAPMLAVAHAPTRGVTPVEDGIIATAYLELAASGAGLGACWCGYLRAAALHDAGVRRLLGIPDDHTCCGALTLGKPALRFVAAPPRPKADVRWL